jgi:hypothetical protein
MEARMSEIEKYNEDKSAFMREVEALRPDHFYPESWSDTDRQLVSEEVGPTRTKTGILSAIPMTCQGPKCHPAGTAIRTIDGYKPIEDLDPGQDLLRVWDQNNNSLRGGYSNGNIAGYGFTRQAHSYTGLMNRISLESGEAYQATHDHEVLARWDDIARDKFCVYIMRKGDWFRVGKSKLFVGSKCKGSGPLRRATMEGADAYWIAGVFDTNTEALLVEEQLSIKYSLPKACFVTSSFREASKSDGLYRWVTQAQLNDHHKTCAREYSHYVQMFTELGLCINCPFWNRETNTNISSRILRLNACNVVSGMMSVPTEDTVHVRRSHRSVWKTVYSEYWVANDILVYGLDVERYHTYIANGLVTHNCPVAKTCPLLQKNLAPIGRPCPIEMAMVRQFFIDYVEELGVDTDRMVEVSMIRSLVDQEIQYLRTSKILSLDHFIQENVIGVNPETGEPIMKKELHMAVELQDKIHKRMERLRSQLLATRESRAKAGQIMLDTAQTIANLMDESAKVDQIRDAVIRKKLGKADVDTYIEASEAEIVSDDVDGSE